MRLGTLCIAVAATSLVACGIVLVATKPAPRYGFLKGYNPIAMWSGSDGTLEYYCFDAKPEAVAKAARAELSRGSVTEARFKFRKAYVFSGPGSTVVIGDRDAVHTKSPPAMGMVPGVQVVAGPRSGGAILASSASQDYTIVYVKDHKPNPLRKVSHAFWKLVHGW
jgi:hypothetical protein